MIKFNTFTVCAFRAKGRFIDAVLIQVVLIGNLFNPCRIHKTIAGLQVEKVITDPIATIGDRVTFDDSVAKGHVGVVKTCSHDLILQNVSNPTVEFVNAACTDDESIVEIFHLCR